MIVVPAAHEDIPDIVRLGWAMLNEAPSYRDDHYSERAVTKHVAGFIDNPNGIALIVCTDKGRMVGFYLGCVAVPWYSEETLTLCEFAFYLQPEARGGQTVIDMLREACDIAKAAGAHNVELHTSTGVRTERTERLYQHLGMEAVGATYRKKL